MQRIVTVILILSAWTSLASADAPRVVSYQGMLTDALGEPASDSTYTVTFSLYDVPSGGIALWSETQAVVTDRGLFSVLLGSVMPLSAAVFADSTRYLGLAVGGTEGVPRVKVGAVAYAFQAVKADTAAYALAAPGGGGGGWSDDGESVRLATAGDRVGIGTPGPQAKLQISGTGVDGLSFNANHVLTVLPDSFYVGVNRTVPLHPQEVFGVHSPHVGMTGITLSTEDFGGIPFYGYAPGGLLYSFHSYDVSKKQWSLFNNGRTNLVVDSQSNVTINPDDLPSWHGFMPATLKVSGDSTYGAASVYNPSFDDALAVRSNGDGISVQLPADPYAPTLKSNAVGVDVYVAGIGPVSATVQGVQAVATGGSDRTRGIYAAAAGAPENIGVLGDATSITGDCYGVYGIAKSSFANSNTGGYFVSDQTGVKIDVGEVGNPTSRPDAHGLVTEVHVGEGAFSTAVSGLANGGLESVGLRGYSHNSSGHGYGVYAKAFDGANGTWGVFGEAGGNGPMNFGVRGHAYTSNTNFGIYGRVANGSSQSAVYGDADPFPVWSYAGWFDGKVNVVGTLSKSAGSFRIDHPLDPQNKYLQHSFVESPDMMNVYNGNVTLDGEGGATVLLPDYFEALNRDFRYQLTAIGAPGPNLYIAQKVQGNEFRIAGGTPGMEVSWQVTGVRRDPYAEANRIEVEVEKDPTVRGMYTHPEVYGRTREQGISYKKFQAEDETVEAGRESAAGGRR